MFPDRFVPTGRYGAVVCGLAVALLLAGCVGLSDDTPDLPDGDEAVERFASVDVYNQTVVTQSTVDNETTEVRIERTVRPATGEQYQVTYRDGNRTVTVSNGTTRWIYRPAVNEVTRIQTEGTNQTQQVERLRDLVDSLETDEAGAPVTPIVPVFPSDSPASGGSFNATGYSEPIETEYRGVETVGTHDSYVVGLESAETSEREISQTLYYDTESFVLMRAEYSITTGDSQIEGQMRVRNISLNPPVDDSTFEFDPPDDATVVTPGIERFENESELRQAADTEVPEPSVPAGFEFERGTVVDQGVSLQYSDGPRSIFVVTRSTASVGGDESEQVDYRGRSYNLTREYGRILVDWRCGDTVYSVEGNVDRDTLLEVGDSIECPTATSA